MSSFANQLTSPLGIKLFRGGPYGDNQAGDKMAAVNDQQLKLSQEYMAKLAPIIAQIANSAGVTNPMNGQQGQFSNDLYGLNPLQQASVNQQASIDTEAYDNILRKVRANLSARGMADSSTMAAAEVYLQKQMVNQVSSNRVQAGQNAYNSRIGALDQIAGLLGGGYGQQQQVLGQKQNTLQYQGQVAQQSQNDAMRNLGQAIGLGVFGAGGGFNNKPVGGGVPNGGQVPGSAAGGQPGAMQNPYFQGLPQQLGQVNWSSIYG
jgi:hypothetical protein